MQQTLRQAFARLDKLEAQVAQLLEENGELKRRVDLVEKGQGFLAGRKPPIIPPFPDELREIGLHPPRH